jgi:UDP-glucose 4-epimerase
MKCLITGASGLLGRNLITMIGTDHELFTLGNAASKGQSLQVNFSSDWETDELPPENDVIIHLAQSYKFREFPGEALDIFNTNISSTAKLLDYAYKSGTRRFIYASTGGIYRPDENVLTEDAELLATNDLTYYFASKLTSEMLTSTYRKFFDVHVFRIFFMYGENQRTGMFLPNIINKVKSSSPVSLDGENGILINPVHVEDVARAIINVIKDGGPKTINAAGPEVLSIKEISNLVGELLHTQPIFEINPKQGINLVADAKKFEQVVGQELISASNGITKLLLDR